MWEEGACIYGTPRVHNNFPVFQIDEITSFSNKKNKKKIKEKKRKRWNLYRCKKLYKKARVFFKSINCSQNFTIIYIYIYVTVGFS